VALVPVQFDAKSKGYGSFTVEAMESVGLAFACFAQFGSAWRWHQSSTCSDEQRVSRCRPKSCKRPAHRRRTEA